MNRLSMPMSMSSICKLCSWIWIWISIFLLPFAAHGWTTTFDARSTSTQWVPSINSAKATASVAPSASLASSSLRNVKTDKSVTATVARGSGVVGSATGRQLNEVSPYIDLALCPIRDQPWRCARQQSARILDVWDAELYVQWQKLKVEADRQLNSTLEKRGYSASDVPIKEKPSTILKKIEIGTNYIKDYLAETMDGFLGHEYEYLQTESKTTARDEDEDDDNNEETDTENADQETEEESDSDDDDEEEDAEDNDDEEDEDDAVQEGNAHETPAVDDNNNEDDDEDAKDTNVAAGVALAATDDNASNAEFFEIVDAHEANAEAAESVSGQLKKPSKGGKRKQKKKKRSKKKKGQSVGEHATVVLVQAQDHSDHDVSHDHESVSTGGSSGHGHGKPGKRKQKRGKRKKKKGQHGGEEEATVIVEHEPATNHLGLGLLEELAESDDLFSEDGHDGGKRKHKKPANYGRSNGVTRGKKKKKKKMLAKVALIGSFLKAKIELLLKILGAHLQIKFFAIALIGLLINIARFWIDVKRGGTPQKVVYVEHAHHQHHYEDHGGDDWSEPGGSYWKRSLHTDSTLDDADSSTDSYLLRQHAQYAHQTQDAHNLAYRNQQWQ